MVGVVMEAVAAAVDITEVVAEEVEGEKLIISNLVHKLFTFFFSNIILTLHPFHSQFPTNNTTNANGETDTEAVAVAAMVVEEVVAEVVTSDRICEISIFLRKSWQYLRKTFIWNIQMLAKEVNKMLQNGEPRNRLL